MFVCYILVGLMFRLGCVIYCSLRRKFWWDCHFSGNCLVWVFSGHVYCSLVCLLIDQV